MQYEFNKPIATVGELKQYIGKPILFYYTFEDMGMGKKDEGKIFCAWIKQITSIKEFDKNGNKLNDIDSIERITIKGLNTVKVYNSNGKNNKFIYDDDITTPRASNAQRYARTLAKEEMNLYRNKTRLRRYGYGKLKTLDPKRE